jgi:alpha/beta superfamily hydrolase
MNEQFPSHLTPSPTAGHWQRVRFPSSGGTGVLYVSLEGRVAGFSDGARHPALLLLHPNPAHGGTMDNKILRALADALYPLGVGSLRYNSRGVGASGGTIRVEEGVGELSWVHGHAETSDIGPALDFLAAQPWVDPERIVLAGFSFGSRIALSYLAAHPTDPRVCAVIAIGFPLASRDLSALGQWPGPKLFITGADDTFCPPAQLAAFVHHLPSPALHAVIKGVGHFLTGREPAAGQIAAEFLRPILGLGETP